jgi:hypothetical protein
MLLLVLYSPETSICFTQMICYLFISIRKVFFVLFSNSTTACVNTFDNKSLLICLLLSRLIVNTFYFDFLVTRPLFSNLLAEHMEWIRQINAKSPSCFPRQQHMSLTLKRTIIKVSMRMKLGEIGKKKQAIILLLCEKNIRLFQQLVFKINTILNWCWRTTSSL